MKLLDWDIGYIPIPISYIQVPGPVYVLNVKRRWMIDCFRIDGLFDWWFPPGIDGWVMGRIDLRFMWFISCTGVVGNNRWLWSWFKIFLKHVTVKH